MDFSQPLTQDEWLKQVNQLAHSQSTPSPQPGPNPPTRGSPSSVNSGDPSKNKMRHAAEKFPSEWPTDADFLYIHFIAEVEDAMWISREIYKEIDKGTISANIYIEKSENSVVVGGPLIKRAKDENAAVEGSSLIGRIKDKLMSLF